MNSCLYKAQVMHYRLSPREHRFRYSVYLFYLDLDEIDQLSSRLTWMSRNKFNLFNFRDKDHLQQPGLPTSSTVRQQLTDYLSTKNITIGNGRIQVLTNLCTLGYQFNPVSFYFCFDENNSPLCSVAEVGNTFGELKPYFLGPDRLSRQSFRDRIGKFFYVSPFTDMDSCFDFNLRIPGEKLNIRIDDYDNEGQCFFVSTLTGNRRALTNNSLLRFFFSIPLITLKIIGGIHWEALKLWIKKVPFHKKDAHRELQQGVYRPNDKTHGQYTSR